MNEPLRPEITTWMRSLQQRFATAIESVDGDGRFGSDVWERAGGGGGETRIMEGGRRIEKAAVNFSAVHGETPETDGESGMSGSARFFATGVSIIVHPFSPHVPTFHANLRYFETDTGSWFGGGADLTPYYVSPPDAEHFHGTLKGVCDRHDVADHAGWKAACDDYFRLPHREEARGIGGLFFDHLTEPRLEVWRFVQDLGGALAEAYVPIVERRADRPVDDGQVAWHEIRRGRYVEFNLVWDRGTRFGLDTGGRTESILASLPPRARWVYDHEPAAGSAEAELLEVLRGRPREWV